MLDWTRSFNAILCRWSVQFCVDGNARLMPFCAYRVYSVPLDSLAILWRWTVPFCVIGLTQNSVLMYYILCYSVLIDMLVQCHSVPMDCAILCRWTHSKFCADGLYAILYLAILCRWTVPFSADGYTHSLVPCGSLRSTIGLTQNSVLMDYILCHSVSIDMLVQCHSVPMDCAILCRWTHSKFCADGLYAILYLIQCHSVSMDCAILCRWIYTCTSPLRFATF